jgi:hypothetical protein
MPQPQAVPVGQARVACPPGGHCENQPYGYGQEHCPPGTSAGMEHELQERERRIRELEEQLKALRGMQSGQPVP